jgi:hypothetical protein
VRLEVVCAPANRFGNFSNRDVALVNPKKAYRNRRPSRTGHRALRALASSSFTIDRHSLLSDTIGFRLSEQMLCKSVLC